MSALFAPLVFHHAAAVAVEVYEGAESVVLPCPVHHRNRTYLSVVWRREDLNPPTVHYKEQRNDRKNNQNQQYRNRTLVSDPLQQQGAASLTLIKPRVNDSGTYTCILRSLGTELNRTEVQLLVKGQDITVDTVQRSLLRASETHQGSK